MSDQHGSKVTTVVPAVTVINVNGLNEPPLKKKNIGNKFETIHELQLELMKLSQYLR